MKEYRCPHCKKLLFVEENHNPNNISEKKITVKCKNCKKTSSFKI